MCSKGQMGDCSCQFEGANLLTRNFLKQSKPHNVEIGYESMKVNMQAIRKEIQRQIKCNFCQLGHQILKRMLTFSLSSDTAKEATVSGG